MTTQPEALRLAALLEMGYVWQDHKQVAAELRRLHAENERLHRFELANNLWHEKTDWVQETAQPLELGRHRADVLKQRIERLSAVNGELLEALKAMLENGQDYTATRDKARAAIARAEGEPK